MGQGVADLRIFKIGISLAFANNDGCRRGTETAEDAEDGTTNLRIYGHEVDDAGDCGAVGVLSSAFGGDRCLNDE